MTKFTPGPWAFEMVPETDAERVGAKECSGFYLGPQGDDYRILNTFLEGAFVDEPAVANAQLITAAPLMYAALEKCAKRFREYEREHRAKLPSGDKVPEWVTIMGKAERNREMADMAEAVMAEARGEERQQQGDPND